MRPNEWVCCQRSRGGLDERTSRGGQGAYWLGSISVPKMTSGFNFKYDLLPIGNAPTAPKDLAYYASGAGQLFARTSWAKDAMWLSFTAGRYSQSHAHQDQGSFMIYKSAWLAIDENINTHSGLAQATEAHNLVRFQKAGTTLPQTTGAKGTTSTMTYTDNAGVLTATGDLTPAYARPTDISSWKRTLSFDRAGQSVRVHDVCTVGAGVEAIWQINVNALPVVSGGSIKAGNLVITPVTPAGAAVNVVDWKAQDASEYSGGGYRIELRGGTEYVVDVKVN